MKNIILILTFLLAPVFGVTAGDIILNNQQNYAVPPGSVKVLILDLTLPEKLESIKILNLGTAQQWDISALSIFEDGSSSGWDGDENELIRKSSSPFWDTEISGNFSGLRIFVTVDISSTAASEKTIKPKVTINSDKTIIGLERTVLAGASQPLVPPAPLAGSGKALSSSAIRWNFMDLANNEFGFKIKDPSLKTVARIEQSDVSYLDETGLESNTCYSGRRAYAFNDRGESFPSENFAKVCTLPAPTPTPAVTPTPTPASTQAEELGTGGPFSPAEIRDKVTEIQQKIIELLTQLIQLLQEQIKRAQASLFNAFETITYWIELRFR